MSGPGDTFIGHEFYDYYETVTLVCTWPDCGWEHDSAGWDENMHEPFVKHFTESHTIRVNGGAK